MDQTDARPPRWPSVTLYGLGFAVNFLDTLGVGSFATTAATLKLGRLVDDERIPGTLSPNVTYRARWQGRGDWLGTATVAPQEIQFKSFGEARLVARSLGLRSEDAFPYISSTNIDGGSGHTKSLLSLGLAREPLSASRIRHNNPITEILKPRSQQTSRCDYKPLPLA